MERMVLALAGMPRLCPGNLPLSFVGYQPDVWALPRTVVHPTLNFCLVLSASAEALVYEVDGARMVGRPPMLVVQRPGMVWRGMTLCVSDGVYFSYDKSLLGRFGGLDLSTTFRPMVVTPRLAGLVKRTVELMRDIHDRGNVDRLDRLAEAVVVEAMLSAGEGAAPDAVDRAVRKIASRVETSFGVGIDLGRLLEEHGLSSRTFTRRWGAFQPLPFKRYVDKLRMEEAKRLLELGGLRVHEVAKQVGFEDPYHFSRSFARYAGVGPREYKKSAAGNPPQK